MRLAAVTLASLALGLPAPADAAPEEGSSQGRTHRGFFVRLDGGAGYASSGTSVQGTDASVSGASGALGVGMGGAIVENLVVAADLWGDVAFSPKATVAPLQRPGSAALSLIGFGLHLTYYLMPANVYASLTPSVTGVGIVVGGVATALRSGFGAKAAIGKEWWVSDHWGLGVAGQFLFSCNQEQGAGAATWVTLAGGLAASATFN